MTEMESPKRKMQKKNDYQRHKLFRKIKRRRKAQAEAQQEVAEKQLKKKLKMPKYDEGKTREVYTKDLSFDDTGGGVDRYGNKFGYVVLPDVEIKAQKLPTFEDIEKQIGRKITQDEMDKILAVDPRIKLQLPNTPTEKGMYAPSFTNYLTNFIYGTAGEVANKLADAAGVARVAPDGELIETRDGDALFDLPIYAKALRLTGNIPQFAKSVYFSDNPNAQYLRYIGGKFKYGFDTKFPDLYRRYSTLPDMSGKYTTLSPIDNRFAYDSGDISPLITNFTTDYPVLPNSGGDWSTRPILRIPGNTLLGKRVVSTRPSDTFTFGENIKVPTKRIRVFDKNTNDKLYQAYQLLENNAANKRIGRFLLEKPRDYGAEFEKTLLEEAVTGQRPRLKDYEFMDYVLQPKYTSQVYDPSVLNGDIPEDLLSAISNAQSRDQLFDGHYKNVVYHPASPVEAQFRKELGIDLRGNIPLNKRKFEYRK